MTSCFSARICVLLFTPIPGVWVYCISLRLLLQEISYPTGDSSEVHQRAFAALRMTKPLAVIPSLRSGQALSAAKDLCAHSSSKPASRDLADFWGITRYPNVHSLLSICYNTMCL